METSLRKIAIPDDVIDSRSYMKYLAYKQNPILTNPLQIASTGEEINIAQLPNFLRKSIAHLAPKEQEYFLELKSKYSRINVRATKAKAAAYGKLGTHGGIPAHKIVKVTEFEQDVIELLGRMFTSIEVVQILNEEYKMASTLDDVQVVLKKHIVEIERKREEFRNKVADVRLFNKRPRLDELSWMYSKMKGRYIALNSIDAFNCMLRTLEQIRKESEGDVLNFKGALDISIEMEIQNQIQREMMKTVNLKEIILGRVAARMNYDLAKLIAGLHNSYYAKFITISGDYDPEAEMKHPSAMSYDFSMIERTSHNEVVDITATDVTDTEKSTADNIKAMFLSKIRKQKEAAEERNGGIFIADEIKRDYDAANIEDETPITRGKGSGKDKIPPSQTKKGNKHKGFYGKK